MTDDRFGSSLQNSWRDIGRPRTKHVSLRHRQRAKQPLWRWDSERWHVSSSQSSREVELTVAAQGLQGGGGPPFMPPPVSFVAQTRSKHTPQTSHSLLAGRLFRLLIIDWRISGTTGQLFNWLTDLLFREQMIYLVYLCKVSLNLILTCCSGNLYENENEYICSTLYCCPALFGYIKQFVYRRDFLWGFSEVGSASAVMC